MDQLFKAIANAHITLALFQMGGMNQVRVCRERERAQQMAVHWAEDQAAGAFQALAAAEAALVELKEVMQDWHCALLCCLLHFAIPLHTNCKCQQPDPRT